VPTLPSSTPANFEVLEDLLSVPGFTTAILNSLRDYVIILPRPAVALTTINVNTTSAEVLAARIGTLSLSQAKSVILSRDGASFRDFATFNQRTKDLTGIDLNAASGGTNSNLPGVVAFGTNYFLIHGVARSERAVLETNALIERTQGGTRVVWNRENQ
jgi:general secretion pathway protein K